MNAYEQELMDNQTIDTNTSSLPDFPGRMLAYNNNTGELGIFVPGEFDKSESIDSIKFAVDFVMKRLKLKEGSNEAITSTYVVGGEDTPYRLTVNGQTYTANSKKDMVAAMHLQDASVLKLETIYIGYAIQINGKNLNAAEPVWYVSRGVNDFNLNDEIKASVGKLNKRTMIKLLADRIPFVNQTGGTNIVMNFEVEEIVQDSIPDFAEWVSRHGAYENIAVYKQAMKQATNAPAPTVATGTSNDMPTDPFGVQEIDISDDDLPF